MNRTLEYLQTHDPAELVRFRSGNLWLALIPLIAFGADIFLTGQGGWSGNEANAFARCLMVNGLFPLYAGLAAIGEVCILCHMPKPLAVVVALVAMVSSLQGVASWL